MMDCHHSSHLPICQNLCKKLESIPFKKKKKANHKRKLRKLNIIISDFENMLKI